MAPLLIRMLETASDAARIRHQSCVWSLSKLFYALKEKFLYGESPKLISQLSRPRLRVKHDAFNASWSKYGGSKTRKLSKNT